MKWADHRSFEVFFLRSRLRLISDNQVKECMAERRRPMIRFPLYGWLTILFPTNRRESQRYPPAGLWLLPWHVPPASLKVRPTEQMADQKMNLARRTSV
jgi:hypothetical protein